MQADFWHQRWQAGRIGFHQTEVNPLLTRHFPELALTHGQRLFVPLCGKTLDIGWLLAHGFRVVGVELNEPAVQQLFEGLALTPAIAEIGPLKRYAAPNIDVFAGDIFDLTGDTLGGVDAVYDRAALVALPEDMRRRYTRHLADITACAPQLLLCFEYDQAQMEGPPFSITAAEIERHYGHRYALSLLESTDVAGGLKGQVTAAEHVWLLAHDAVHDSV